jgi:hypothetical protein
MNTDKQESSRVRASRKSNKQEKEGVAMKRLQTRVFDRRGSRADRSTLINGITLLALGLSVLFLNSWDKLYVRITVGLFWGTFMLIVNWPGLIQTFRSLKRANELNRRRSKRFSTEHQRSQLN